MTVNPDDLRIAMRQWTTGVAIVTVQYQGIRHGMTVNSFTSVSLTPPLVLVSLERTAKTHGLVEKAGTFGVTILADHQQGVSECFAGRTTEHEDRFSNLSTHLMVTGAPFIDGGLAFFDCQVVSTFEAGTHTLFIGEVIALETGAEYSPEDVPPLVYYDRSYRGLQK